MNELVVIDPSGAVQRFPLTFDELGIGREPTNQIVLDDPRVSRKHARVYRGEKGHYIEDLGSANGVLLDGSQIRSPTVLHVGAKIEVGGFVITVVPQGTPAGSLGRNIAKLKGLAGLMNGKDFVIGDQRVTVGRIDSNQIVIDDPSVSRHHARIERQNGKFVLTDLGSSNGTFVGGRPIQTRELKDGDKVMFGSVAFRFSAPGGKSAQALPAPVVYALAVGVVLIAIAVAAALLLRPRGGQTGGDGAGTAEMVAMGRAAMQREDWEAAQRSYEHVLEKDATNTEAKTKLALAKELAVHKTNMSTAEAALERGDKVTAMQNLMRIPSTSVYADKAQKIALSITEMQRKEPKGLRKDLKLTEQEEKDLKGRYSNPKTLAAVALYLKGDLEGALNALAKLQKGKGSDANAPQISKDIRSVRLKQTDGAIASQANDVEKAVREWDEALKVDLNIAPATVRSQPRQDIRRNMGDAFYRAGYQQYGRAEYQAAFSYWKRGSERNPENLEILQGFGRLESHAEQIFYEADRLIQVDKVKACTRLNEVVSLTLDTANVNAKARARLTEQCR